MVLNSRLVWSNVIKLGVKDRHPWGMCMQHEGQVEVSKGTREQQQALARAHDIHSETEQNLAHLGMRRKLGQRARETGAWGEPGWAVRGRSS